MLRALHAVDGDGRVYTYRELYVRQQRADQVAQSIIKLSGDEEISYTVASPDMWQKRGAILKGDGFEGESLAELFARGGVPLASADNARIAGWQRVRGYMADGADGRPCGRRLIAAKTLSARCHAHVQPAQPRGRGRRRGSCARSAQIRPYVPPEQKQHKGTAKAPRIRPIQQRKAAKKLHEPIIQQYKKEKVNNMKQDEARDRAHIRAVR